MRLSTKATYGMRALLDIAQHSGEGPVLLKDIAKRQEIALNYLGVCGVCVGKVAGDGSAKGCLMALLSR